MRRMLPLLVVAVAIGGVISQLGENGVVAWRRPYMSDRTMRRQINADLIKFKDDHLSRLAGQVRAGDWGAAHVAVVEAVAVTEKGHLVPTMSVGNTPTYVREAEKIIIEISQESKELEGIHDIYIPEDPPYRMPIPIYRTGDRIGKPFIEMDPDRVVVLPFENRTGDPDHDVIGLMAADWLTQGMPETVDLDMIASSSAIARPIPRLPPVTMAVVPSIPESLKIILTSSGDRIARVDHDRLAEVGRLFNDNQLIVAEVLQSAEVMKAAVSCRCRAARWLSSLPSRRARSCWSRSRAWVRSVRSNARSRSAREMAPTRRSSSSSSLSRLSL